MKYEDVVKSRVPFNRRVYKDGWYIRRVDDEVDRSLSDLSIRKWTSEDLEANDWWTLNDCAKEREENGVY